MVAITQGLMRTALSSFERLTFDEYDKDGDGVISYAEYKNYLEATKINKANSKDTKKSDKGFDLEQFDPQGTINFESNGGFDAKKLNLIA